MQQLQLVGFAVTVPPSLFSNRQSIEPPGERFRVTEICGVQSIDMPLELFLDLVCRLLRILAQAGLVDIATVHANVTVDDHHRAHPRHLTLGAGSKANVKAAITAAGSADLADPVVER